MPRQPRVDEADEGQLYQSRFKSFPIQDDAHFLVVCRYIERNALRARLVSQAESLEYGSLWRWLQHPEPKPQILLPWPLRRSPDWGKRVKEPLTDRELEAVRRSLERGRPFGDEEWTESNANRLGLWSTLRPRGRPRKKPPKCPPSPYRPPGWRVWKLTLRPSG